MTDLCLFQCMKAFYLIRVSQTQPNAYSSWALFLDRQSSMTIPWIHTDNMVFGFMPIIHGEVWHDTELQVCYKFGSCHVHRILCLEKAAYTFNIKYLICVIVSNIYFMYI